MLSVELELPKKYFLVEEAILNMFTPLICLWGLFLEEQTLVVKDEWKNM